MGAIKTEKLDNGMIGLEITYGGKEAPFGGIDSSAPPMYIDGNCFVDAANFMVINEQLIPVGYFPAGVSLGGWVTGMFFMDMGHFCYMDQYYIWALAYEQTANVAGPPAYIDITYTIWVWIPGSVGVQPITAQCVIRQFAIAFAATNATATINVTGVNATAAGTVTIQVGAGAVLTTVVNIGDSAATVASNMVTTINAAVGYPCTAVIDSFFNTQIDLTATTAGSAGNNMSVVLGGTVGAGTIPLPALFQGFTGGVAAGGTPYGLPILPTSWVQIGETLYFGGPGTMILQFTFIFTGGAQVPSFEPITQYLGANTLAKFNNQLIAVGITPGPGQNIQAPEMIIGWSASNKFWLWNPVKSDGTVTGAGFNQITDIADYLTGMIICPGSAIIIRSKGLDYITPVSGGSSPFDFQHISNAKIGEGSQDSRLITQYDQVGFFVGTSEIYQFTGSLMGIGDKIKNLLLPPIPALGSRPWMDSTSGIFNTGTNVNLLVMFILGNIIYTYCPNNKTWMIIPFNPVFSSQYDLEFIPNVPGTRLTQTYTGFDPWMVRTNGGAGGDVPTFWVMDNAVQNVDFPDKVASFVLFPQEEVSFGRDITIDGLLVNIAGTAGQVFNFSVSGVLQGTLTLPVGASPSVYANYQVFFSAGTQDVLTVQNPQLRVDVPLSATGVKNTFSIGKCTLFGSFDPNQRPV